MAKLPVPQEDGRTLRERALAFVLQGKWRGDRRLHLQDHECRRAAWYAGRWFTERAPAPPETQDVGEIASLTFPPAREEGIAAALLCGGCLHRGACRGGEPPAKSCRTCAHVRPMPKDWGDRPAGWYCALLDPEVTEPLPVAVQRKGCPMWEYVHAPDR